MVSSRRIVLKPWRVAAYGLILIWCVVVYFPLYWCVITSLKTPLALMASIAYFPWIDFQPTLDSWRSMLLGTDAPQVYLSFTNGAIVSLSSAAVAMFLGGMAGYGLTRFTYRFGSWRNNDIAFWFVSQRIMPPIAVVLAFLILYRYLGLVDTRFGLALAYTGFNLPLAVWILRDFFAEIPKELEESALLDAASWLRAFWSIAFPLALPGLVAVFILCFIFTWNEYLFALILTFQRAGTVPLLLASQVTATGVQYWRMAVLAVLSIVPSVICAVVLERYIVSGLFSGGVKA